MGQGNTLCTMHYAAGIYATIRLFNENNFKVGKCLRVMQGGYNPKVYVF